MSTNIVCEAQIDDLLVSVYPSNEQLGQAAAKEAAAVIQTAIHARGTCNIIVATGNSQLTFLPALRAWPGIEWPRVNIFHLDEYVGLAPEHPAGFRNYLHHHLIDHINPKAFYSLCGETQDPAQECKEYEVLLRAHPADLCALGIGENGHLAFNDPPFADFADPVWVKVVELADASRRQQVGEGHFRSVEEVPARAMTLTIPAMLSAKRILAIVPEARKANAVCRTLHGPVSAECPSSLLRRTAHAHLLLDAESAAEVSLTMKPPADAGRPA